MKFDFIQDDFSGGEISPRAQGRVSSELWKSCVAQMQNCIPCDQGSFQSRAGLMKGQQAPTPNAVKLIPLQDSPYGDISLEITVQYTFTFGYTYNFRLLDERGNVLSLNGKVWDFTMPAGLDQQGPSPGGSTAQGWQFQDSTGAPASFYDPIDDKICLRNTTGSGSVAVWTGNISAQAGFPSGTSEVFTLNFTFSGSPISVEVQAVVGGGAVLGPIVCTNPGDYTFPFNPAGGAFILQLGFAGLGAANIWNVSLIKNGMTTQLQVAGGGSGTAPPFPDLNKVRAATFWAQPSALDYPLTITEVAFTDIVTDVPLAAIGGSFAGWVWSLIGADPRWAETFEGRQGGALSGALLNTIVYRPQGTLGATPVVGTDYIQVVDSAGNATVLALNYGGQFGTGNPILVVTQAQQSLSPGQKVIFSCQNATSSDGGLWQFYNRVGSVTGNDSGATLNPQTGEYTAGPVTGVVDSVFYFVSGVACSPAYVNVVAKQTLTCYSVVLVGLQGLGPQQLLYTEGVANLGVEWTIAALAATDPNELLPALTLANAVVYYQGRLWLGFNDIFGHILGSATSPGFNYYTKQVTYQVSDPALATDAIDLEVAQPTGEIVWLNVLRGLVLGTTRAEKVFSNGNLSLDPATGQVFDITDESSIGSDPALPAVDVNDRVAFFTHGRRSMRLAGIQIQSNGGLVSGDPGFLGEHLLYRRVRSFCFLKSPVQRMVFAFDDGSMAVATLAGSDIATAAPWKQPFAWNEMDLPAQYKAYSVAALDTEDGSVLMVGTTTGQTLILKNFDSRSVVKTRSLTSLYFTGDPVEPYTGSATAQFDAEQMPPVMDGWVRRPITTTGLIEALPPEMIGQAVSVIVNGVYAGQFTASSQSATQARVQLTNNPGVTWGQTATPSEAFVGLPYPDHQVTMLPLEGGNPLGTSQGLKSRHVNCYIRLVDSYLPLVGGSRAQERSFGASGNQMDVQAPRVTGDVRVTQLGFNRNQQLVISMDLPLRMEVSAVYGGTQVNPT